MTVAPERPATSDLISEILAELQVGFGELRCVGSERLIKQGVSMTHLHVLSMLHHHGSLAMSRLAELLDVSVSNATGLIDRLEERGWVERLRDRDDRRIVLVELTAKGSEILDQLRLIREDFMQRLLEQLSETQLAGVAGAIRDLRGAAEELVASDPTIQETWHAHGHSH